ncbi:MAG: YncE family protein, partial [Humibacillus sp.]
MKAARHLRHATAAIGLVSALVLGGCSTPSDATTTSTPSSPVVASSPVPTARSTPKASLSAAASALTAPYAHTGAGDVTGAAVHAKRLVYVPNQVAGTLEVIDPSTRQVIRRVRVAASPEHVVPSWDLSRLWVNSDRGDALTPIDPLTGQVGRPVAVRDPYNLYFTPDGRYALVMASRFRAIDVLDAKTMRLIRSLPVPDCAGVNHADFTADLRFFVASCEFNGRLFVVDAAATKVVKVLDLNAIHTPGATSPRSPMAMTGPRRGLAKGASSMPQDVRLTPDGRWFMVADMLRNGVWFIDATHFTVDHFVPTGAGTHGIYPSRDARSVYVSNRDAGTVTVFDAVTYRPRTTWTLPGHATPDMGGVTADGSQLWLSGRYSSEVYVIDTRTGR